MNPHLSTLLHMTQTLQACQQGQQTVGALVRQWREQAGTLALPARFGQVLAPLLDRLEAGALFNEESCSFSQKDLLESLHLWADKARERLNS